MTNQEYIFSLLKENEGQPVAFYTSQYDYSGNTNIKSLFDESVAKAGQINGGYEHHSALSALAKKVAGVQVIDKGWRFMILKYERGSTTKEYIQDTIAAIILLAAGYAILIAGHVIS